MGGLAARHSAVYARCAAALRAAVAPAYEHYFYMISGCVSFLGVERGGATHRTALGATTNRSLALSLTPALWSWLWTCGSSWWALSPGFSLPRFHLTCPPARGPKRAGSHV